jgi:hypothetical protein
MGLSKNKRPLTAPNFQSGIGQNAVIAQTNGTTPVNVFGANGAPCPITIVGGYVIALDTTAGNITMQQAANTVFTAAKGATSGLSVNMGALANAVYAQGDVCTVKSSSAGNALVVIFYTVN